MTTENNWDDLGPLQTPFPEDMPLQLKELASAAHAVMYSIRLVFGVDEGFIGGDMDYDAASAWFRLCRVMHGSKGQFGANADNLAVALVRLQQLADNASRTEVLIHDPQGQAQ
jgi:hypothetical protein